MALKDLTADVLSLVGGHLTTRNAKSFAQSSRHAAAALEDNLQARREDVDAQFVQALDLASRLITRASVHGAEQVMAATTDAFRHTVDAFGDAVSVRGPRFGLSAAYGGAFPASVLVNDGDARVVHCFRDGKRVTAVVDAPYPESLVRVVKRALQLRLPKTYRVHAVREQ